MKSKSIRSHFFSEGDELARTPRKPEQDLLDYPTYTITEAATYLAIPPRTLYRWVSEKPFWETAGIDEQTNLLSFRDIAQSYFIEFIRHHTRTSTKKAREILERAKAETGSPYPLLHKDVKVVLSHVVYDRPARGRRRRQVVDLSQYPQYMISEIVDLFATRFNRNKKGEMVQIFPWRFYTPGDKARPVSLDPDVLSGRLVITGTRIPARVVWERTQAGEKISDLALDYRLSEQSITDALRHLALRKAA
jgi:uncharacterized protein (DUF433 family)